jgi:hypothetical protein
MALATIRRLLLLLLAGCTASATEPGTPMTKHAILAATVAGLWTASAGAITADGTYTAPRAAGEHAVTFTHNGFVDTALVTTTCDAAPTIDIDVAGDTLDVAGTLDLIATVTTSCVVADTSLPVVWTSGDPAVATVASTGSQTATVTAVGSGAAYIYGTWSTARDSVYVCVTGAAIDNTEDALALVVPGTGTITATVTTCGDTASTALGWKSRNLAVATVVGATQSATVTAVGAGTTYIVDSIIGSATVKDSTLVTVTAAVVGCDSVKTNLQFLGQFEAPDPFRKWNLNEADGPAYAHAQSTTTLNECAGAVRIELRKSDPFEAGNHRAEIKIQADSANASVAGPIRAGVPGNETWFGWSIYVPSDFVFETAGNNQETVTQIKGCITGRSPVWEVQIDKGTFEVFNRFGASGSLQQPMVGSRPITKGAWHHFVLHAVWRSGNTGVLEMWMNGNKFIDRQNTPTIWSDCSGAMQSTKVGIYKWSWDNGGSIVTTRVLFFDNVRLGTGSANYGTVVPR